LRIYIENILSFLALYKLILYYIVLNVVLKLFTSCFILFCIKIMDSFWITNISDRVVMLGDLGVAMKPKSIVNLLSKHYHLTREQVEKSVNNGSIFRKRHLIFVRQKAPDLFQPMIENKKEIYRPGEIRSLYEIEHKVYEEIENQINDKNVEIFAEEMADITDEDQPFINIGSK